MNEQFQECTDKVGLLSTLVDSLAPNGKNRDTQSLAECVSFTSGEVSNSLVVKALDSKSRGPELKTTGWLQSRLSLSSFLGRSN